MVCDFFTEARAGGRFWQFLYVFEELLKAVTMLVLAGVSREPAVCGVVRMCCDGFRSGVGDQCLLLAQSVLFHLFRPS